MGWIPTITGNLSFATIGSGRNPQKKHKYFRVFDEERFTIVVQKRSTSDANLIFKPISNFFEKVLLGREGTRYFMFVAVSELSSEYNCNVGKCYIFDNSAYNIIRRHLKDLKGKPYDEFTSSLTELLILADEIVDNKSNIISHLLLYRSGKINIHFRNVFIGGEVLNTLASQIYFFVRDITHMHQHHEISSDTILEIYPARTSITDAGVATDEVTWRRETQYALYRWIIARKRAKKFVDYVRSKGVLAYAEAFHTAHIANTEFERCLPIYRSAPIRRSLDSSIDELKNAPRDGIQLLLHRLFVYFVPFLAVFISFLGIVAVTNTKFVTSTSNEVELFNCIIQFFVTHPIYGFFGFLSIPIILFIFDRFSFLKDLGFVLNYFRVLFSLNWIIAVSINFVFALFFLLRAAESIIEFWTFSC